MFSVVPATGVVGPNDKPLPVQVCVVPRRELAIRDEPVLQCRVIEPRRTSLTASSIVTASVPSVTSLGDVIANIPIRVTCQSSYSKHVTLISLTCSSLLVPICS